MVGGGQRNTVYFLATFLALFVTSLLLTNAEANFDYPSIVKPSVSWINNDTELGWISGELLLKPIFVNGDFVCGFFCKFDNEYNTCLFAISTFRSISEYNPYLFSKMVWSANRNKPVGGGAKLQFSQQGGLRLQNVENTLVWAANTTGKSVSGLKLTDQGNLMLFDGNNETVWQSFEHPTDSLVLGQRLVSGQYVINLQAEYARRPSMSIVLKFLEGKMEGENEYDFSNPAAPAQVETVGHRTATAALIPSVLSGPR